MAVEERRLCGYRKVGGVYMVGRPLAFSCKKLPMELCTCPTCGLGIKYARNFTWVNARALSGGPCTPEEAPAQCKDAEGRVTAATCPFAAGPKGAGILWVGRRFYSPQQTIEEAARLGISRRIRSVVRGLELGKTWVLLAHVDTIATKDCKYRKDGLCTKQVRGDGSCAECGMTEKMQREGAFVGHCTAVGPNEGYAYEPVDATRPGLFYAFKPDRWELLVTQSQFDALTPEAIESYDARHIKLVVVPDADMDHQGSVWDEESEVA